MTKNDFSVSASMARQMDPAGRSVAMSSAASIALIELARYRHVEQPSMKGPGVEAISVEGEAPFGTKTDKIRPLGLTDDKKADLAAFFESLSGSEVLTPRPELPSYGILAFPMDNQW